MRQDDDSFPEESLSSLASANIGVLSQPKMPPYPIAGYVLHEQTSSVLPPQEPAYSAYNQSVRPLRRAGGAASNTAAGILALPSAFPEFSYLLAYML